MPVPEIPSATSLYETDFYAWTQEQVRFLRDRQWSLVDLHNLIDEVESLGKQQRQELRNRLSVLLGHLLKWEYQPWERSRRLLASIRVQRREALWLLQENPSLEPVLADALLEAYENSKDLAMGETVLFQKSVPPECPYSFNEVLDSRFYPGKKSALVSELEA
jgi:Domain of unknown function DUF29